jgi:cell division protein FtsX
MEFHGVQQMKLTPLEGYLAAMSDSQFSWIFYLIAFFQVSVAVMHLTKKFRSSKILTIVTIASLLIFPALLIIGFYFATRPVA